MTLAEIEDIGREVGITPEVIREAASVVGRGGVATARHFLGLPLGVGRTIELDRTLTDDEWERLVVDLRETFDARGTVRRDGSLRQWTNGNLQALVEPTATGHRVRLRTVKGDARTLLMAGLGVVGVAAGTLVGVLLGGIAGQAGNLADVAILASVGAALFAMGALRLPGWARIRRQQMEGLAARLAALASTQPPGDPAHTSRAVT